MKKYYSLSILIVGFLLLMLQYGCQTKSGFYFIYINSHSLKSSVTINSNKINKQVNLPYFEEIGFSSTGGNTYNITMKTCKIQSDSLIRGYVGIDRIITVNGQNFYPHQIFAENYQGLPSIRTADSLLNYLKQTGSIGYFEILPTETCKTVSTK